jgi:hypothetical protein
MAKRWFFGAIAIGLSLAAAGVAVADGYASNQATAYFAAGKHQFYVWCASGHDFTAVVAGASAEDAQMKLYDSVKVSGRAACWPVWQGKVQGSW